MADITKINLNGTELTIVDSAATSAIAGEIARAQGAESAITSALSAEVVARESADTQIQTALSGKADTATTLAGYGITDAYTSAQTNSAITQATSGLQATLTPGTGIEITSGNVINCTIDTGLYVVVQSLPEEPAPGNENKIHLVPLDSGSTSENDQYEEYLWDGTDWEYLGTKSIDIDLSDYWTSAQTQSAITSATSGLASTQYVDSAITAATSGLATESYVQTAVSGLASETYVQSAITAAVSGITAEYSAATETLILNIPNPSA